MQFTKKKEILLQSLKQRFLESSGKNQLSLIRVLLSCGEYANQIIPKEISKFDFNTRLMTRDAPALCNVLSRCAMIEELNLSHCGLSAKFLEAFKHGLLNCQLKVSRFVHTLLCRRDF